MKFEEILPALRAGKKVTSYSIDCEYIYYSPEDGELYTDKGCKITLLTSYVMKLDDWEIVKEKKKVKLRDLTKEQYEEWVEQNCIWMCDDGCRGCPFKKVKCDNRHMVDDVWYLNKNLYSDKFLDKEIEIEE